MEYSADERGMLRDDEKDLFAAVIALGDEIEELDVETEALMKVFRRGEEWRDGLTAIRR